MIYISLLSMLFIQISAPQERLYSTWIGYVLFYRHLLNRVVRVPALHYYVIATQTLSADTDSSLFFSLPNRYKC